MELPDQAYPFHALGHIYRAYFECVRNRLGGNELHPRQGPIMGVLLCKGSMSQAELVRSLDVSAATVAVSVARLEKQGMIKRERDEYNRRANILTLTPKGREEAQRVQNVMQEVQSLAFQGFSEEELARLTDCIDHVLANLRQDSQSGKEGTIHPC